MKKKAETQTGFCEILESWFCSCCKSQKRKIPSMETDTVKTKHPRKKALKSKEYDEIVAKDPNKKWTFGELSSRLAVGSEMMVSWKRTGVWVGAEINTITYRSGYDKYSSSSRKSKIDIEFGMWVKEDDSYSMDTMRVTVKRYVGKINIEIFGFRFITTIEKENLVKKMTLLRETTFNTPEKRIRSGDRSLFLIRLCGMGGYSVRRYSGVFVVDKESFNSWRNTTGEGRRYDEQNSTIDEVKELPKGKEWLLMQFVVAFHLPSRSWGYLDFISTSPPEFDLGAWDSLVLDSKLKKRLEGVVRCARKDPKCANDFISNKGQGFNILLHGSSGLGKTLTAQALSSQHQKVVFSLNAGDLGSNIEKVEEQLAFITNIVSRWNIYIQIDECDLFISNRMESLILNELTCAFLRFLENHPTIVFLTTNMKTKDIDAAIRSRIHVFVEFPEFNHDDRQQVWTNLLNLFKVQDTKEFLEVFGKEKLNGREIRNILFVARAIMNDDGHSQITVDDVREAMKLSLISDSSTFLNLYQ